MATGSPHRPGAARAMTDFHTHILPGMDDGAKNVETSLEMLRMERDQGVDTVVLTPHFYGKRERADHFLKRREHAAHELFDAIDALPQDERESLPRLLLGAEVAWVPNLPDIEELPQLKMGDGRYMLLELPFSPWNDSMIRQIYDLMGRTGLTPVIAHLERYIKDQRREYFDEILSLGVPIQLSSDPLLHTFSRGKILKMLKNGQGNLLASDCHDTTERAPNLALGVKVAAQKLGEKTAGSIVRRGDSLIPATA